MTIILHLLTMSSQQQVAIELGYDSHRVARVLAKKKFACAGDLIDYLEDNEDEKEEKEKEEEEKEITEAAQALENCTLLKETEQLYRQSICRRCVLRSKSIVCLPCCHLSLCKPCHHLATHCPTCGEIILDTIVTYMA